MLFADAPSKRFIVYGVCFLVGVAIGSLALEERRPFFVFIVLMGVLVPPLVVFWRSRITRTILYCAIAVVVGAGRVNVGFPVIDETHIASRAGGQATFVGWVAAEPDAREDHTRLIVRVEAPYRGRVLVKTDRYPVMPYGTPVEVTCELERPQSVIRLDSIAAPGAPLQNDKFRYDRYLRRDNIYALCRNAEIRTRLAEPRGSRAISALLGVKHKMQQTIGENLPEPHASFLGGLLYGARSTIPAELQDAFKRTGTSHIIAISGYNITIVASIVMLALVTLFIPRKKAFWLAIAMVAGFVVMVGAQASVVRAGFMGVLALTAKQMGRLSRPLPLIMVAAAGMALVNPFVLLFDAGFQLSFLAVIGLMYLAPDLEPWFAWLPKKLGQVIAATLGAIVLTTPLMLYQFDRFSVVAPVVNTLILLAIPWIMLGGFAAVVGTWVISLLGKVLFGLTWVLLSYVIETVELFARLPFASVEASVSWWVMVGVYGVMMATFMSSRAKPSEGG